MFELNQNLFTQISAVLNFSIIRFGTHVLATVTIGFFYSIFKVWLEMPMAFCQYESGAKTINFAHFVKLSKNALAWNKNSLENSMWSNNKLWTFAQLNVNVCLIFGKYLNDAHRVHLKCTTKMWL